MIDRSRWHPVRKVHVDQCRFGEPGPYLIELSPRPNLIHSNSWCRNDWGDRGEQWIVAARVLRERFKEPCT